MFVFNFLNTYVSDFLFSWWCGVQKIVEKFIWQFVGCMIISISHVFQHFSLKACPNRVMKIRCIQIRANQNCLQEHQIKVSYKLIHNCWLRLVFETLTFQISFLFWWGYKNIVEKKFICYFVGCMVISTSSVF